MTTLPINAALAEPAAPLRTSVVRVLREMIARVRRRRREAITIAHLKGLPNYLLADIGLTRDRVSGVIGGSHGQWHRPPEPW